MQYLILIMIFIFANVAFANDKTSTCFGDTTNGHLENGWQLPASGNNFEAYSMIGVLAGRNYVHSDVHHAILDAYKILEKTAPGVTFVYGETGFENGGRFKPHKTHANGTSVDFFVPVLDKSHKSTILNISAFNKLGYNIELNQSGYNDDYKIDFESIAKHLLALNETTKKYKIGITVVIFDNDYQNLLFKTKTGKNLKNIMYFSVKKPWVRHDEHYHIDFIVKCQ